jgi:hypothetical protein
MLGNCRDVRVVIALFRGGRGVGLTQTEVCHLDDGVVGADALDEDVGWLGV